MHRIGGEKNTKKKPKKIPIFLFFSEIGNFNIGGPVNQLIKKGLSMFFVNLKFLGQFLCPVLVTDVRISP
jgi:hypothetical protein